MFDVANLNEFYRTNKKNRRGRKRRTRVAITSPKINQRMENANEPTKTQMERRNPKNEQSLSEAF